MLFLLFSYELVAVYLYSYCYLYSVNYFIVLFICSSVGTVTLLAVINLFSVHNFYPSWSSFAVIVAWGEG